MLDDYGDIIKILLMYIKTNSTLKGLIASTPLKKLEIYNGLALLITRRFLLHTNYNNVIYYNLSEINIQRRHMFSHYVNYIHKKYNNSFTNVFILVLCNGHFHSSRLSDEKIAIRMLNAKILECVDSETTFNDKLIEDEVTKKVKIDKILRVNYEHIEENLLKDKFFSFINTKYNSIIAELCRNAFNLPIISIKNLKVMLVNQADISNENDRQIEDMFLLLTNDKILTYSQISQVYVPDWNMILSILKQELLFEYLRNKKQNDHLRIFKCIISVGGIEDKKLSMQVLMDGKKVRKSTMDLHINGFINIYTSKMEGKITKLWGVDLNINYNLVYNEYRGHLIIFHDKINELWKGRAYTGGSQSKDREYIEKYLEVSGKLFLLSQNKIKI